MEELEFEIEAEDNEQAIAIAKATLELLTGEEVTVEDA
jgi:hypothetical protein